MVTDENPDLISWNQGKLFINDPVALERKMSVYFRHSNFSSFQRQLNNFGFRKVEGKGKLAPCMYEGPRGCFCLSIRCGAAAAGDAESPRRTARTRRFGLGAGVARSA